VKAGRGAAGGRAASARPAAAGRDPHRTATAGHLPRKRFGQHFLADIGLIDQIVRAIDPRPGQPLVEIGPGLGALTLPLLQQCQQLTVIELDRDLAARLRRQSGLTVIEADVLKVDFAELQRQWPAAAGLAVASPPLLRVVGNLPYNISTPILFHLLAAAHAVQDQHFMLQKEVVERMAASPGCKDYGRLTVMLQWRYRIEHVLDVPPEAFDPPPRVDSAVVRMVPLPAAQAAAVDAARLGELVACAFSQRRKILRHTLGRWIEQQGLQTAFDLQRRAEEVPVQEYLALARLAAQPC
jgi:16S rRNA (adenine1518-N6/adenine1519-N6)-dimethyltransferase